MSDVKIEESWKKVLEHEFEQPYFSDIKHTLIEEKKQYTIFPPAPLIFNAFNTTPFDRVKVVILWQDPYHGPGQAMGLSFSVPEWITPPPSLKNIYKEINADLGLPLPTSGDLTSWAEQWVLLLNAILTVRANTPASHQQLGWHTFTDAVIKHISAEKEHVVFMLWGNFAKGKKILIDTSKHLVLEAPHPSPFSVHTGFFGCKHFSKANEYLVEHGRGAIDRNIQY